MTVDNIEDTTLGECGTSQKDEVHKHEKVLSKVIEKLKKKKKNRDRDGEEKVKKCGKDRKEKDERRHHRTAKHDDKVVEKKRKHKHPPSPLSPPNQQLDDHPDEADEFQVVLRNKPSENLVYINLASELKKEREARLWHEEGNKEESEEESENESEDSDGDMAIKYSRQFLDILPKIQKHHPDIYNKDNTFFPDESGSDTENPENGQASTISLENKKKMTTTGLMDHHSSQPSFVQEQALLKRDLLEAAWNDADSQPAQFPSEKDDEFMRIKVKTQEEQEKMDKEFEAFQKINPLPPRRGDLSLEIVQYPSTEAHKNDAEKFLMDYFTNKRWVKSKQSNASDVEDDEDSSQEDDVLEKQDDLERVYNFRFEEPSRGRIVTHPRNIVSARIVKKNTRAMKKKARKEKKRERMQSMEEEKIQLKKQKKKEIVDKISKISSWLTPKFEEHLKKDLDDGMDWDPEKHDKEMEELLRDGKLESDSDLKMNMDDTDDIIDDDISALDVKDLSSQHWMDIADKIAKSNHPDADEIANILDEYSKLDYEDYVGNQKMRFQYVEVPKSDHGGLTAFNILEMSDEELERIMPSSEIAPYSSFYDQVELDDHREKIKRHTKEGERERKRSR